MTVRLPLMRARSRFGLALACLLLAAASLPAAASAAAPANDDRDAATVLTPPATASGTTAGSTLQADEPGAGGGFAVTGTVWYRFSTAQARRVAIRLTAEGELDAALTVFRRARSQYVQEQDVATDEAGQALVLADTRAGAQYFVRVARRATSVDGRFRLEVLLPQLFPAAPGPALPAAGTTGTIDALANASDAWSVVLHAGITYRIRVQPLSGRSVRLALFAPGTRSFAAAAPLKTTGSYVLFTPAAGEGGRHSLVVSSAAVEGRRRYRLQVGRARQDDEWPGRVLHNFTPVRAAFDSDPLDVVDTYRFDLVDRSAVTIDVRSPGSAVYDVRLLRAGGGRLGLAPRASGRAQLKRTLQPGRYVVVIRGRANATGRYVLRRAARTLTRVRLSGPAGEPVLPGTTVPLAVEVTPAVSGPATVTIERFDPYTGWHFARRVRVRVGAGHATVAFRPPAIGRWRARATYDGTRTTEASATRGDTAFRVAGPLEP